MVQDNLRIASLKSDNLSNRDSLSEFLSDVCLALLRKQTDWNSVAYEITKFNERDSSQTEVNFQRTVVTERSKFEREVIPSIDLRSSSRSDSTQAVVSIVVALRGDGKTFPKNVDSSSLLKELLRSLAADAMSDDGENVLGVEVLWTPSDPGDRLSDRDLIQDYPELLKF